MPPCSAVSGGRVLQRRGGRRGRAAGQGGALRHAGGAAQRGAQGGLGGGQSGRRGARRVLASEREHRAGLREDRAEQSGRPMQCRDGEVEMQLEMQQPLVHCMDKRVDELTRDGNKEARAAARQPLRSPAPASIDEALPRLPASDPIVLRPVAHLLVSQPVVWVLHLEKQLLRCLVLCRASGQTRQVGTRTRVTPPWLGRRPVCTHRRRSRGCCTHRAPPIPFRRGTAVP